MSTPRVPASSVDATDAVASPESRAVIAYAGALIGLSLVALVVLVGVGCPLPTPGLLLLLAIPLALCMNRFVLFPNEGGVTAEAAVLFTAIVLCRDDAVVLGPLVLALLVGPLDARHWERRSFVRMAYNSGSQALTVLVGVAVFVPLTDWWGSSAITIAGAITVAAVPYALVETGFGVTLFALLGDRIADALRLQLPINALVVPLALYGAAVGLLADDLGWWLAPVLLVPTAFLPELVLVSRGRRVTGVDVLGALSIATVGGGAIALAAFLPVPDPMTMAALLAGAALLGVELRVDRQSPVPLLLVVVVMGAAVLVGADGGLLAAMVVGVTGTAAAWTLARPRRWAWAASACMVVSVAATAAAALYDWLGGGRSALAVALLAALLFEAVVLTCGPGRRVGAGALAVWSWPIVAAAMALADLGHHVASASVGGFALGVALMLTAVAWSAAPPWRGRVLGGWAGRIPGSRRAVVVGLATASLGAGVVAVAVAAGDARTSTVLVAVALGTTATGMTLAGVRQWRFVPRRCARECGALLLATGVMAIAYPPLAFDGSPVSIALLTPSLAVVVRYVWGLPVARPAVRRAHRSSERVEA